MHVETEITKIDRDNKKVLAKAKDGGGESLGGLRLFSCYCPIASDGILWLVGWCLSVVSCSFLPLIQVGWLSEGCNQNWNSVTHNISDFLHPPLICLLLTPLSSQVVSFVYLRGVKPTEVIFFLFMLSVNTLPQTSLLCIFPALMSLHSLLNLQPSCNFQFDMGGGGGVLLHKNFIECGASEVTGLGFGGLLLSTLVCYQPTELIRAFLFLYIFQLYPPGAEEHTA